jgi:hypothetical protein
MTHDEQALVKAPSLSLYDREAEWKELTEFLASAESQSALADPEFAQILCEKWLALEDKRDSFAAFMAHMEVQIGFAAAEEARLAARRKSFTSKLDWLKTEVVKILRSFGQDDKGAWKKLSGRTSTLALHKNPPSVEITDATLVPGEYKRVDVTIEGLLPADAARIIDALGAFGVKAKAGMPTILLKNVAETLKKTVPCGRCGEIGVVPRSEHPDPPTPKPEDKGLAVCPDCRGEKVLHIAVPGARLVTDKVRLVRT